MSDQEEIERRITALPHRAAAAVALRAAMRVFPVFAMRGVGSTAAFGYWPEPERARHAFAILRCYQILIFGNSLPKIKVAAARAADAAAAAARAYAAARAAARAAAAAAAARAAARAYAAARAAARAAAAYAAAAAAALEDIQLAERSDDLVPMLTMPLWPKTPGDIQSLWRDLQKDLRSLDAGFDVWIKWYQDRLDGKPLDLALEEKWALLPDEVLTREPAGINAYLAELRDEHYRTPKPDDPGDPGEALPEIPESQEPGLQFAPGEDGKIDLKPSGLAPPDDLAEIAAMRGVIIEAIDDLAAVLEGSNAYGTIQRIALRYKATISAKALSIDQLYAYGVRLENVRARLEREIQSGDYPDLAVPAGEALDSVIALHGPAVYSTARGRELIEKARAFREDGLDVGALKPVAVEAAAAIRKSEDAATEQARDAISEAAGEIGEGAHPERSTQIGVSGLVNFMITAAKIIVAECESGARDGIKSSAKWAVTGGIAAGAYWTWASSPALFAFFTANASLLHQLALVTGGELSWLPSFLHWVDAKRAKLKI